MQALMVMTNVASDAEARSLARRLIDARLAACVNILPGVQSIYRWQGQVEEAQEVTLLIKTIASRYALLESAIREAHSYDVPEIIALPIVEGSASYLDWVARETMTDTHA